VAEPAVLYVKSEKISQVEYTMPNFGHWCSAGYRATKTDFVLGEKDRKAIEILEKVGLRYTLVDLGLTSATTRIKAKIESVNTTPTLIYKGQKIKGLQQIVQMVEAIANI